MSHHSKTSVILTALFCVSCSCAPEAFALGGKMQSGGDVSLPSNYPAAARKQIADALNSKDYKFQSGFFINWNSTIRYRGDTPALNVFLDRIAKCPAVKVFTTFKKLDDACDWRVNHDGLSNTFQVVVNLRSQSTHLEDLVIPCIAGPQLAPNG